MIFKPLVLDRAWSTRADEVKNTCSHNTRLYGRYGNASVDPKSKNIKPPTSTAIFSAKGRRNGNSKEVTQRIGRLVECSEDIQ
ncbi:hypothetical protein PHLCEN_2v12924 [Hermanssonia centrifuga]|uniref:Uncharacterized protein n=1 Tax=Hermanssonia centrifuga TaxID=98765 RepID=A0A2R6NGV0_9APHY|nr:hypothetical protein PHLCEN_2v12924 [Hermanssonia centrifuga]